MSSPVGPFQHAAFAGLIGVAREDITPPVGIYNRSWGAALRDVAEGIHRPLTATVLTLQAQPDDAPLVLIGLDLGWWRQRDDEYRIRNAILTTFKLDASRVMINLLHTHAGPSISRADADKPGGHLVGPYLDSIQEKLVGAVKQALASRTNGELTWTVGHSDLATNRDLPDPSKPRRVVGFNPKAPADTAVLVGRVTDSNGKLRASLVNYACHPVTLAWDNALISPDFAGGLREVVEGATHAPCLFLQGNSGELAPREQYVGDVTIADANGRRLGYAALAALHGMLPAGKRLEFTGVVESGTALGTWGRVKASVSSEIRSVYRTIELALRDLPTLEQIDAQIAACADRVMAERLRRKRFTRQQLGTGATVAMPIWVWRVGDAFLIGHPNEAYSYMQRELRRRFPHNAVISMNLVNGGFGYLPEAQYYAEEMYTVTISPFERGSLEKVVESCAAAIEELGGMSNVE